MISRRQKLWVAASAIVAGTAAIAMASRRAAAPLRTTNYVDLDRYLGRWYEIARLPASFETGCSCTTAEYSRRADGTIRVLNSCLKGSRRKTAEGVATVADARTNAKLKVSFFWPFKGDYWVLELDPEYRWALVGEPGRDYLWILSRTPQLEPNTVQQLVARARADGFPVDKLIFPKQQ